MKKNTLSALTALPPPVDARRLPMAITALPSPRVELVYSTDRRLRELQQYYRYPSAGLTYKTPPELPREVADAMESHGFGGEPLSAKYRFIWLGVATVRASETDGKPAVRGDERACKYQMYFVDNMPCLRLEPKKLHMRTRSPQWLCYRDAKGNTVRVVRPDQVPNKVNGQKPTTWWQYVYTDFGALEWRIEQRVFGDDLVRAQLFKRGDDMPKEVWQSVMTIKSANGLYAEPSLLHVDDLRRREQQERSLSRFQLSEVTREEYKQRSDAAAEAEAEFERKERAAFEEICDDVIDFNLRQPRSVAVTTQDRRE